MEFPEVLWGELALSMLGALAILALASKLAVIQPSKVGGVVLCSMLAKKGV